MLALGDLLALGVGLRLRKLRQLLVGRFLFGKISLEKRNGIFQSKLVGPGDQGAVARDLVVFNGLRRGDQPCIERR